MDIRHKNHDLHNLWLRVLKRHRKHNIISGPKKIHGHSLAIGVPGSAKTSGNRRELEIRYRFNHKIFCLYDGGTRMDMGYSLFPSNHPYWKKPKVEGNKIVSARKFPTELLYPITSKIKKVKIPKHGIPFTIPVCDLDEKDLLAMVGDSSKDTISGAFAYIKPKLNEESTPQDFLNLMGLALRKTEDTDGIKPSHHGFKKLKTDIIQPLINEGILSSKKVSTAINVRELIKNKKISVLVLRHCPSKYWGFLVNFLMNHISRELSGEETGRRLRRKTTISLNEVADLLDKDTETGSSSDSIKKSMGRIAKQSRSVDIFMVMDTQLPQELPDLKETLKRIYVYRSGNAALTKAMEIMGVKVRTGQISDDEIAIIPFMPPGYYFLFDRDSGVSFHKAQRLRSREWLEGEDFYQIYDNYYGNNAYTSIKDILAELNYEKEKSIKDWEIRRFGESQKKKPQKKKIEDKEDKKDKKDNSENIKEVPKENPKEDELKDEKYKKEETSTKEVGRDYSWLKKMSGTY